MKRMVLRAVAVAAAAIGLFVAPARADEVHFKNGDKLTGKIVSAEGSKLKFRSSVAGTVEVDLTDVKTFSSDGPVRLRLDDGTVLRQPVTGAEAGQVAVKPGAIQGQNVPIARIKSINAAETWTGSLVAGLLITRGNSDTDAYNFGIDAVRRTDLDRITLNGQYLFGRQRDEDTGLKSTSTDNWRAGGKYDYFVSKQLYAFGSLGVEKDRIANLNLRLTPAAGLGYQWVERPDFNVNTEVGGSWVYEDYTGADSTDQFGLKLAYHMDKRLREGVRAFHNLAFYPSVEKLSDYYLITDAGLRADLTDKFFTEFKVEFKYDATPGPDASRSDLRYILGVGWGF